MENKVIYVPVKDRVLHKCPKAWCEHIFNRLPSGRVLELHFVHLGNGGRSNTFQTEQEAWESADRFVNPSFYQ